MNVEVDPNAALDAAVRECLEAEPGQRLHGVFVLVTKTLTVEKHEVRAALHHMKHDGAAWCDLATGKWYVNS